MPPFYLQKYTFEKYEQILVEQYLHIPDVIYIIIYIIYNYMYPNQNIFIIY